MLFTLIYICRQQTVVTCWGIVSVGQIGRLDHLSCTWQQQNSWNWRKLFLGDTGNCWLMMRMHVWVLWSGSWTLSLFRTSDGSRWVGSGSDFKATRCGLRCWFWQCKVRLVNFIQNQIKMCNIAQCKVRLVNFIQNQIKMCNIAWCKVRLVNFIQNQIKMCNIARCRVRWVNFIQNQIKTCNSARWYMLRVCVCVCMCVCVCIYIYIYIYVFFWPPSKILSQIWQLQ